MPSHPMNFGATAAVSVGVVGRENELPIRALYFVVGLIADDPGVAAAASGDK